MRDARCSSFFVPLFIAAICVASACSGTDTLIETEPKVVVDGSLDLGHGYVGGILEGSFVIASVGTGPVHVLDITTQHPEVTVAPSALT